MASSPSVPCPRCERECRFRFAHRRWVDPLRRCRFDRHKVSGVATVEWRVEVSDGQNVHVPFCSAVVAIIMASSISMKIS